MFERVPQASVVLVLALAALTCPVVAQAKPYKGGELYSSQQYHYGRMEVRMRTARGSGILSTFFTYKNGSEVEGTFWEEIDIEVFGKDDAKSWQSNIITGTGTRATSEATHTHSFSLADDYHTYALTWTPEYVAWELDGQELRRTTSAQVRDLTNPQSFRFNLWAANIESWVGAFSDAVLPQYQFVNWLSYSRYENGQFIHEWTEEFDSLDESKWARADWTFGENLADFDPSNVVIRDGTLVLALTRENMTGFAGTVPRDTADPSTGGSGGASQTGGSGGMPAGTGGATGASGGAANPATGGSGGSGAGGSGGLTSVSTGGNLTSGGTSPDQTAGGSPANVGGLSSTGGTASTQTGGTAAELPPSESGQGCTAAPRPTTLSLGRSSFWLALLAATSALVWRRRHGQDKRTAPRLG